MNPETKLTLEQIKAICALHDIPYQHHERITSGFSHEVHRLNDDLIIKIFNTYGHNDARRFQSESAVLASNLRIKKPHLIACSEPNEIIDRGYIVMSFVPGNSLGSTWHLATNTQREALIREISESLRLINTLNRSGLGLTEVEPWQSSIKNRVETLVAKLTSTNTIDVETANKVLQTVQRHIDIFKDDTLHPVYWDIHFDNFIVNDVFELQAIIDLENVELTSLDYPIFVIQKQMDEPEKYLREEDEKYADTKDYKYLKTWYQQYYPEMFAFKNLEERLKIYQMLDVLHLLTGWPDAKELYSKLDELIS